MKFILILVFISLIGRISTQCLTGGTKLTASNMDAVIPTGQTYYIDSDLTLNSINVSGTLYFKDVASNLSLKWLRVNNGAKLYIGQETCKITSKITITLNGPRDETGSDMGTDPADGVALGSKGISVATGGSIEVWGAFSKKTVAALKALANKGDNFVYVDAGTSWAVGDKIVVVETDYPAVPFTYTEAFDQNEVVMITAVNANVACPSGSSGTCDKITFNKALNYTHYWNAKEYGGEVAHLTRNIVFQGDVSSGPSVFGGHLIIRSAPVAKIVGAEFTRFGQRGVVGRYPIHFHQLGQTDGVNVFAKYNSIHDNFQRCLVIHDSNSITVEYNVAYNTTGSCYFLEDGGEINNVFNYNLGAMVLHLQQGDRQIIPTDTQASVFWIPNPLNNFTYNIASGGTFGFWYVMPPKPNGKSQAKYANDVWMSPRQMPLGKFQFNIAHSNRDSGIMVDQFQDMNGINQGVSNPSWTPRVGPYNITGAAVPGVFSDILVYKNRNFGSWYRASSLSFTRIYSYDNRIGFQAVVMPATIQNSVFVCETANAGNFINPGWNGFVVTPRARAYLWSEKAPIYGYQNYDASGPQFQNNNTFGGCFTNQYRNSSIISSLENAHNILFPQNRYLRTKVDDGSQRMYFQRYPNAFNTNPNEQDSPKYVYVHDVDGTVTGKMGTWMVPHEPFHTYGLTGCSFNASENCQRCPPFYEGFGYLNIKNTDTGKTDFAGTATNATDPWIRSSWYYFGDTGKANGMSTAGEAPTDAMRTEYRTNFITRRGIMVNWPHPSPPSVDLMFFAAAPGDWVVVGIPYPSGTFTVTRNTWPQANFTLVTGLDKLVADTYYYANNVLYVRLENTLSASSGITNAHDGGFVYQASWNNQVSIKHNTCTLSSCAATASVPAALAATESLFKADLCPATGSSNTYGVAFFGFDVRTRMLSYQIYHGKGPQSFKLTVGGIDLGIPYSPAEGVFTVSYLQYVALYSGQWTAQINELVGTIGCDTSRNSVCTAPPAVSTQAACSIAQDDYVIITSNALNKITGKPQASWSNWSWSNTTIGTSTDAPTGCSGGSLSLNTKTGALSAHNDKNGIVVPLTYSVQFWAKAVIPKKVDLIFQLDLADSTYKNLRVISKYINLWAITDEAFTKVTIPLVDFGFSASPNISRVTVYYYQASANQTILLTDLRFIDPAVVSNPQGQLQSSTQYNYVANNCFVDPGVLVAPVPAPTTTTTTGSTTTGSTTTTTGSTTTGSTTTTTGSTTTTTGSTPTTTGSTTTGSTTTTTGSTTTGSTTSTSGTPEAPSTSGASTLSIFSALFLVLSVVLLF